MLDALQFSNSVTYLSLTAVLLSQVLIHYKNIKLMFFPCSSVLVLMRFIYIPAVQLKLFAFEW